MDKNINNRTSKLINFLRNIFTSTKTNRIKRLEKRVHELELFIHGNKHANLKTRKRLNLEIKRTNKIVKLLALYRDRIIKLSNKNNISS